ncbi:MAG: hypothetical protein ACQGVC_22605 [Myxococcota bacterium]
MTARRMLARVALATAGMLALLAGSWLVACGRAPDAPDAGWPPGALLSARREAATDTLARLARLEGTPLAHGATRLLAELPDCPELAAHAADARGLAGAIGCAGDTEAVAGLRRYRGDADLALALPVGDRRVGDGRAGDGPRVLVTAREQGDRTRLHVRWPDAATSPKLASLLPGDAEAGAPVLVGRDPVLHARIRSEGLDLAALVAEGGQADELFRLRGELLSSTLLDGSWEFALYPPAPGREMPRVAAALGVRMAFAARSASERFLDDVESRWPVHRQEASFHGQPGVCLPDLNLLPELAPCLVVGERALVLGWNGESLAHALAPGPLATPVVTNAAGRVEIDFARLAEADRELTALQQAGASHAADWPWRRWVARAARAEGDDAVLVDVELLHDAGGDS